MAVRDTHSSITPPHLDGFGSQLRMCRSLALASFRSVYPTSHLSSAVVASIHVVTLLEWRILFEVLALGFVDDCIL